MSVKQALTIKAFSVLSPDLVSYIIHWKYSIGFLLFYLWCWMLVKVSLQIPLVVMSYKNAITEDDKFILIVVSGCLASDLEDINENFSPCIFADCCSDSWVILSLNLMAETWTCFLSVSFFILVNFILNVWFFFLEYLFFFPQNIFLKSVVIEARKLREKLVQIFALGVGKSNPI